HLMIEHQERRLTLLFVLEEGVAALPNDVPEEDRALAGIHPVLPGRLPVAEPRVGRGPRNGAGRPRHGSGAVGPRPDVLNPVLPDVGGRADEIARGSGSRDMLPRVHALGQFST